MRTILALTIQERAKLNKPAGNFSKRTDVDLQSALNAAKAESLFDSGEYKLLALFEKGGQKAIFDNIAHKPGSNSLIEPDALSFAVDNLLNKLLGTIT